MFSRSYFYNSYLLVGRRTSVDVRAFCMSQLARLCKSFESGDDSTLEMLYRSADRLLRDLFVLDSDLSEFEQAVHLVRNRNVFGETGSGTLVKSQLRDVTYAVFARPELAAPSNSAGNFRQGGFLVESKAATGLAARGANMSKSAAGNDSSDEDNEDSSSSSEESDSEIDDSQEEKVIVWFA
jgi:hypothetical protein